MPKVRVDLSLAFPGRSFTTAVVIEANPEALLKVATNKFKLKRNDLAQAVLFSFNAAGEPVKLADAEPLRDGAVVVVTTGEHPAPRPVKKVVKIAGGVEELHGRVMQDRIDLEPGIELPPVLERLVTNAELGGWKSSDWLVVILRGFPGSGKSSLANLLRTQVPSEIVSADDYWTGAGSVQAAHEHCRQVLLELLQAQRSVVIVDNTNMEICEYSLYRDRAESAHYAVAVMEMVCESTAELERFRKRSVHDVPGSAVGLMLARYEQDLEAFRFAPHVPEELL